MIREFSPDDIIFIEELGRVLNSNYKFKINPYTKCLVYEENSRIIGFVVYSIMYEKAEIIDIVVNDEYQRKNIGSKLLEEVLKACINNKCSDLTLEVRAGNQKAINFYKKHGFREISMRKSYYHDGEDALVMIKMVM